MNTNTNPHADPIGTVAMLLVGSTALLTFCYWLGLQ